jgi:hypothetical protein
MPHTLLVDNVVMNVVKSMSRFDDSIVSVLSSTNLPLDVEKIRVKAGIKNWQTAKAVLLELMIRRTISGRKTSKSWIFWIAREDNHVTERGTSR